MSDFRAGWKAHLSRTPGMTLQHAEAAHMASPAASVTRTFTGTLPDGRSVLVTLHDGGLADAVVELAFRDQGHWGIPTTLTEEKA